MRVSTNGIVVNQAGQLLLMLRDDTRTWTVPGGMLEQGELPSEGVVREVREETGVQVRPLRLLKMTFWPFQPQGTLEFTFHCAVTGGTPTPSDESPRVGYFPADQLPGPMLNLRRELIEQTTANLEVPPIWQTQPLSCRLQLGRFFLIHGVYRFLNLRRRLQGRPYIPPPLWTVEVRVLLQNEREQIMWVRQADDMTWHLPGGCVPSTTAPWMLAENRLQQAVGRPISVNRLAAGYVDEERNHLCLVFIAPTQAETDGAFYKESTRFFPPDNPPTQHKYISFDNLTTALDPTWPTIFQKFKSELGNRL